MGKPTEEDVFMAGEVPCDEISDSYMYNVTKKKGTCYIWNKQAGFVGSVVIDISGAWTQYYEKGVGYLPINSALRLLDYPDTEKYPIE